MVSKIDDLKLAELLCARFSHDLAGPIGAVNNGVEFLSEGNSALLEKATDLVKSSAIQAVTKLQFLRQAYGYVAPDYQVGLRETMELVNNFFQMNKTVVTWEDSNKDEIEILSRKNKLLLNIFLLASIIIIVEGKVNVKIFNGSCFEIAISGKKIFLDDYYFNVLNGDMEMVEVNTKNVHIEYLNRLIKENKAKFQIVKQDGNVVFTVTI